MYFVNVLIDMNMNGEWDGVIGPGVSEWAVTNFPVVVAPGVSQNVTLPPFVFANGNRLPDGAWMRISLTDSPILATPSWDGSGTFAAGEIEDHVIDLPRLAGPGGGPRKSCVPTMICPQVVKLPEDGTPRNFACAILNQGSNNACTFNYTMNRATPGADASDIGVLAGTCAANGPANIGLCGPTGQIAPAPRGLLIFAPMHIELFQGQKNGDLPSVWTYLATYNDPQAVVTSDGVTIGYQDSFGATQFVTDDNITDGKEVPKYDLEQLQSVREFSSLKELGVTIPEIFDVDIEQQMKILELYSPENLKKY